MLTWVSCPVVDNEGCLMPLVGAMRDPGQAITTVTRTILPPGVPVLDETGLPTEDIDIIPPYTFSGAIQPAAHSDCVVIVRGDDLSGLLADARVKPLLTNTSGNPIGYDSGYLASSMNEHGWVASQRGRLTAELARLGGVSGGLNNSDPLWMWIERMGQTINSSFKPLGNWTGPRPLGGGGGNSNSPLIDNFPIRSRLVKDSFGGRMRRRRMFRRLGAGALYTALTIAYPWASPGLIAAVIIDTFTVAVNTDLTAHVPDTGTGWTEEENTFGGGTRAIVDAVPDNCRASNSLSNSRFVYSVQPNPTDPEYDVLCGMLTDVTTVRPLGLIARNAGGTGPADGYYGMIYATSSNPDAYIIEVTSTTVTALASGNFGDNNVIFKFEILDATKKWYAGATERLSTTDNTHTSAGKWGIFWGNVRVSTDDIDINDDFDNFEATLAGAGPTTTLKDMIGMGIIPFLR